MNFTKLLYFIIGFTAANAVIATIYVASPNNKIKTKPVVCVVELHQAYDQHEWSGEIK